jgi:ABC-2 type transport system ATP-binding protein
MAQVAPVTTIETQNLGKRYAGGDKFALKSLNIKVKAGEVYGYLGPNGSGKSTTIKLLMNFIQPTEGSATIAGRDIVAEPVPIKRHVGYLAGEVELYSKMTGRDFLRYMAELQPPKSRAYQQELAKAFQASLNQPLGSLSKGNRQKIGIIQAFMHQPDILILDEPTDGLDPLMQEAFYELVRNTKQSGATFFVSSHNLTEVQKMCDRVGFIRSGKLIAEHTIADLAKSSVQTFDIAFADEAPVAELRRIKNARVISNSPRHVSIEVRGQLNQLFTILAKHQVHSLGSRSANLEEEFLHYYKDDGKK